MELQHLRYFVDIARLESISKAAEQNHVAQPALSRVVSLLEKEFGAALFDRVGRNIRLNACGQVLLDAAERSLTILDSVQEEINYYNGHMTGKVRICLQAPLRSFGEMCRAFREIYPLVELEVEKPSVDTSVALSPEYNLFIYVGPATHKGHYCTHTLLTQEVIVLVHKDNPLAQKDTICLQDLAQTEFIMPQVYPREEMMVANCYNAGFVPQKIHVGNHPTGQRMLIDTQPLHRAVVAFRAFTEAWNDDYKILSLSDPNCGIPLNLAWSKGSALRPSVEAFRDYMIHFYGEQENMI